jgi:hypothetical protein
MKSQGVFVSPVEDLVFTYDESLNRVSGHMTIQNFTGNRICFKVQCTALKKKISAKPSRGFVEPNCESRIELSLNPRPSNIERLSRMKIVIAWNKASAEHQDPKAFWSSISNDNNHYCQKPLKCVFEPTDPKNKVTEKFGPGQQTTLESHPQNFEPPQDRPGQVTPRLGWINSVAAQALIIAIIGIILRQIFTH